MPNLTESENVAVSGSVPIRANAASTETSEASTETETSEASTEMEADSDLAQRLLLARRADHNARRYYRRLLFVRWVEALALIAVIIGLFRWLTTDDQEDALLSFVFSPGVRQHGWYVLLSVLLGIAVGASELISRYRDEPTRALINSPAMTYLLVNASVSALTYLLLTRYGEGLIPALSGDPLMRSVAAGLGAMAILRSKVFTLRTENGEDIGVGPDAAISTFLSAADRGVDRRRAARRLDLVFHRTTQISCHDHVKEFIQTSLSAFQNVSEEERNRLQKKIEEIYDPKQTAYPDEGLKLQALAYYILVIVGEEDFNQLMTNLEIYTNPTGKKALQEGLPSLLPWKS